MELYKKMFPDFPYELTKPEGFHDSSGGDKKWTRRQTY